MPADTVFFGEVGLAGEIRQVAQPDLRLKESAKLGFARAVIPKMKKKTSENLSSIIEITEVAHVQGVVDLFSADIESLCA